MDGFKVLQMVKLDPQTTSIPVVVLSGRGQSEEIEKALKLGASDFLVKMRTNPNILVEKVQKTLAAAAGQAASHTTTSRSRRTSSMRIPWPEISLSRRITAARSAPVRSSWI